MCTVLLPPVATQLQLNISYIYIKWAYLITEFLCDKVQSVSVTKSSPLRIFGDKILKSRGNI